MSFDRKNGSVYFAVVAQILMSANTGDFKQYKELFLTEYEHTIKQLQGVAPEQLEAQSKALKKILAAR